MHLVDSHPVSGTLLIAIPFFVILFFSIFGADLMKGKRKKGAPAKPPSGVDEDGNPILSDPDGRRWKR